MARTKTDTGTAKTTRLRKLECDRGCGYIVRVSRSAMDRGLPGCPCGGRLAPAELEDIWRCIEHGSLTAAEAAERPAMLAYEHELHSVERGQERAAGNGRRLGVSSSSWRAPHDVALERVHKFTRAEAAALRAAALVRTTDTEPIPF